MKQAEFSFRSIGASPHSSSECYITGQFQKASSRRQSTIWPMPSVDSKGAEASWISQITRNGWYFCEGSCRGWRHLTMCSDLSPLKEDGHGNDTGLLWWSRVVFSSLLSLSIAQPLSSQYWLSASAHAQNILAGRILTAKSWISKSGWRQSQWECCQSETLKEKDNVNSERQSLLLGSKRHMWEKSSRFDDFKLWLKLHPLWSCKLVCEENPWHQITLYEHPAGLAFLSENDKMRIKNKCNFQWAHYRTLLKQKSLWAKGRLLMAVSLSRKQVDICLKPAVLIHKYAGQINYCWQPCIAHTHGSPVI